MPDGSWRDRKRVRLYIKSGNQAAMEQLLALEQWDYAELEGFLGSWNTQTQYGEKADPCFVVARAQAVPVPVVEFRFAESKKLLLGA